MLSFSLYSNRVLALLATDKPEITENYKPKYGASLHSCLLRVLNPVLSVDVILQMS